ACHRRRAGADRCAGSHAGAGPAARRHHRRGGRAAVVGPVRALSPTHRCHRHEGRMKPNLIYIVADDLGYADLGCYGGRGPVSPVLDSLAVSGLMLTQGYANSPVCSPTRFALMTARYQYRLRGAAEEP